MTAPGRCHAVVAGGGTGGHVLLALAVARAVAERGHERAQVRLVGSRRGQERVLLAGQGFPLTLLPGRGLQRRAGPRALGANAGAVAATAWAVVRAVVALARWRPDVVVSVGGYASFPAGAAAVVLGVPIVVVNVDALPGLAHRLLGRFAAASAVALPGTPLPKAVVTGSPVRAELVGLERSAEAAGRARDAMDLPAHRRTVASFGGSLGARRINRAVADLAGAWSRCAGVTVVQVTGRRDYDEVRSWLADDGAPDDHDDAGLCHRLVAFEDRMDLLYAAADLVVCRAGAITVAELAVAGVPSVLVPLPGAPGDHQTANARALVDAGAAVLLADADCDGRRLGEVLGELLADPERLRAMARAAGRLGVPDAAARVAEVVESAARDRSRRRPGRRLPGRPSPRATGSNADGR